MTILIKLHVILKKIHKIHTLIIFSNVHIWVTELTYKVKLIEIMEL